MESRQVQSGIWNLTLTILEILLDIIKAVMVLGGVLAANLADVLMGSIAISILFGGATKDLYGIPAWQIGVIISVGASAIQIVLWMMIKNRGYGLKDLLNFKRLPTEVKTFLVGAVIIWFFDTMTDVSPVFLLVKESGFQQIGPLNNILIAGVTIMVVILCGFSEPLTANIKFLLKESEGKQQYNQNQQRQGNNNKNYNQSNNNGRNQMNNQKLPRPDRLRPSQIFNSQQQRPTKRMNEFENEERNMTEEDYIRRAREAKDFLNKNKRR
jgi:hypothetical protein